MTVTSARAFTVIQWLTVASTGAMVVLLLVTVFGLQNAADERAQAACAGARDTRQVLVDLLEFTGEQQLDPDDYTGDLRTAVIRSQQKARTFRNTRIAELERPPPGCQTVDELDGR